MHAKPVGSDGKLRLVQASTRGDGHVGEDVTDNVKVLGIPVNIQMPDGIWKIELRGECYMSEEDFEATNARKQQGRSCLPIPVTVLLVRCDSRTRLSQRNGT